MAEEKKQEEKQEEKHEDLKNEELDKVVGGFNPVDGKTGQQPS